MLKFIVFFVCYFLSVNFVYAEDKNSESRSKIEKFDEKYGTLIVRGFTEVFVLGGLGGNIKIEVCEFKSGSDLTISIKGLRFSLKEHYDGRREFHQYMDKDKIDDFLKALEFLKGVNVSISSQKRFEVLYEMDNMSFAVVNDDKGELILLIIIEDGLFQVSGAFKMEDIEKIKQAVEKARSKLD